MRNAFPLKILVLPQWAISGTSTYQRHTQRRTPSGHQHGSSAVPETSDRSLELCWYHAGTSQVPSLVPPWYPSGTGWRSIPARSARHQWPTSDHPVTNQWPYQRPTSNQPAVYQWPTTDLSVTTSDPTSDLLATTSNLSSDLPVLNQWPISESTSDKPVAQQVIHELPFK